MLQPADTRNWSKPKLLKFTFLFLIICFLVLELCFRIYFQIKYRGCNTTVAIQGSTIEMDDSLLIFKNRPFYTDHNLRFQFNEEGMRSKVGDALMPEKTKNDFWVFLFGASAMEGAGSAKVGEWIDITGTDEHNWQTTIAYFLQNFLQEQMPAKKVKVFCAANNSYSIYQSILKYQLLSKKYKMDWVISMDGNNEPAEWDSSKSLPEYLKTDWNNWPIHHFPTTWIIPFTGHSAFINGVKQFIYAEKWKYKMYKNEKAHYPVRLKWYAEKAAPLKYDTVSEQVKQGAALFWKNINGFDSLLSAAGQKHFLLVQPHLSKRNSLMLDTTEKAVYNYFSNAACTPAFNQFQRLILNPANYQSLNIITVNMFNDADYPVFTDYCHLTNKANKELAKMIADKIIFASQN